jgi:hypothetical protein
MKKSLILFTLIAALPLLVAAQEIKASPFEGRWVWNGAGEYPHYEELIFFGNIMLVWWSDLQSYTGTAFTHTGRAIEFDDSYYTWQYRLSGNNLTITDEYNETSTYVKTRTTISPLEGIWKLTGGNSYDKDYDRYMLFTADIMAAGEFSEYEGFKVDFNGSQFYPDFELFELEMDAGISKEEYEAYLEEMGMLWEYSMSGESLTLDLIWEKLILTRIY